MNPLPCRRRSPCRGFPLFTGGGILDRGNSSVKNFRATLWRQEALRPLPLKSVEVGGRFDFSDSGFGYLLNDCRPHYLAPTAVTPTPVTVIVSQAAPDPGPRHPTKFSTAIFPVCGPRRAGLNATPMLVETAQDPVGQQP